MEHTLFSLLFTSALSEKEHRLAFLMPPPEGAEEGEAADAELPEEEGVPDPSDKVEDIEEELTDEETAEAAEAEITPPAEETDEDAPIDPPIAPEEAEEVDELGEMKAQVEALRSAVETRGPDSEEAVAALEALNVTVESLREPSDDQSKFDEKVTAALGAMDRIEDIRWEDKMEKKYAIEYSAGTFEITEGDVTAEEMGEAETVEESPKEKLTAAVKSLIETVNSSGKESDEAQAALDKLNADVGSIMGPMGTEEQAEIATEVLAELDDADTMLDGITGDAYKITLEDMKFSVEARGEAKSEDSKEKPEEGVLEQLDQEALEAFKEADAGKDKDAAKEALKKLEESAKEKGIANEDVAEALNKELENYEVKVSKKGELKLGKKKEGGEEKSESKEESSKLKDILKAIIEFFKELMKLQNKQLAEAGNPFAIQKEIDNIEAEKKAIDKNGVLSPEAKAEKIAELDKEQARLEELKKKVEKKTEQAVEKINTAAEAAGAHFEAQVAVRPSPGIVPGQLVLVPNPGFTAQGQREISLVAHDLERRQENVRIEQTGNGNNAVVINGDVNLTNVNVTAALGNNNTVTSTTEQRNKAFTTPKRQQVETPVVEEETPTEEEVEIPEEDAAEAPPETGSVNG